MLYFVLKLKSSDNMKFILSSLLCLALASSAFAQGIEFFTGSWEQALEEAKAKDKVIFVDAYTTWCGPCKMMAKNVFPDPSVGDFFNRNFISVKLDMEADESISFRKKHPVSAYPTLFFIDGDNEIVQKTMGAKQPAQLLDWAKQVASINDKSGDYAAEYDKGSRDPELIYNYLKALNASGKPSQKIANDYLRTQKDLTTAPNLMIILEATTEADSKAFDLLVQHRKAITAATSTKEVQDRILMACKNTAKKSVEVSSHKLLEDSWKKMKKHHREEAAAFRYTTEMEYALAHRDADSYVKAAKAYSKKVAANKPEELHKTATDLMNNFKGNNKALAQAEAIAQKAAQKGNTYEMYYTYANLLAANKKSKEALIAARKSLELAKVKGGTAVRMVEAFVKKLEAEA